jgi:hypothetical protein
VEVEVEGKKLERRERGEAEQVERVMVVEVLRRWRGGRVWKWRSRPYRRELFEEE